MKKSTMVGVAVFASIYAVGFVGGVDYTQRGPDQAFTLCLALALGGLVKLLGDEW